MMEPTEPKETKGQLQGDETHPMVHTAARLINRMLHDPSSKYQLRGALATVAIEGNRCADIMLETLDRLGTNRPVGERYILALGLFIATSDRVGDPKVNPTEAHLESDLFDDHYGDT